MKKSSAAVIKWIRIKKTVRYGHKHTIIEKFKVTDIKCCQRLIITGNKPLENNLSFSYKFTHTTQHKENILYSQQKLKTYQISIIKHKCKQACVYECLCVHVCVYSTVDS